MADPVVQVRIRNLTAYAQADVGDPNYVDPDEISLVIDHADWELPKRLPLTGFTLEVLDAHVEIDTLTNLSSRNVNVTFNTPFSGQPAGREPEVYRLWQTPNGTYRRQDVLWGFTDANQPTANGFSLIIDPSESLVGVIIQYEYK
jgi:hypothetical protein